MAQHKWMREIEDGEAERRSQGTTWKLEDLRDVELRLVFSFLLFTQVVHCVVRRS